MRPRAAGWRRGASSSAARTRSSSAAAPAWGTRGGGGPAEGANVLGGGERLDRAGWHLAPTVIEGAAVASEISCTELFGPVTLLYRVRDLDDAIAVVNDSPYGLTSSIHT